MKITIIGRGLIGGSLEMASRRAGFEVAAFDRGERPAVADSDVVLIAVPPSQVEGIVSSLATEVKTGAVVVDMTGVKGMICEALSRFADETRWTFVGGHPMAGKERAGYANACATLFDGASMILVPFATCPPAVLERLDGFFRALGFTRIVVTDARHHDEMIALTSQLCHLISSAYVRDELAKDHAGYSAGSFRDMVRVGAPDPDMWTELFMANRPALLPVLRRYIGRLGDFAEALETEDRARLYKSLEEGVAAKSVFGEGLK